MFSAFFHIAYGALLHIHSLAHLLIRGTALVFVGRHRFILGVAGLLNVLGPVPDSFHILESKSFFIPLLE